MHALGVHSLRQRLSLCFMAVILSATAVGQAPERGPLVLSITAITSGSAANPVVGHVPFFSRTLKAETSFFQAAPAAGSGLAPAKAFSDVSAMVTWSSSNANVVAVDGTGNATLGPDANGCISPCAV